MMSVCAKSSPLNSSGSPWPGKGIGKAVAEIQSAGVRCHGRNRGRLRVQPSPEPTVTGSITRSASSAGRRSAGWRRIPAAVNHDSRLEKVGGRHAATGGLDCRCKARPPVRRARSRPTPRCRQSSRQSTLIVKQIARVGDRTAPSGAPRSLADRQQPFGETGASLETNPLEALPNRFGHGRLMLSPVSPLIADQPVRASF